MTIDLVLAIIGIIGAALTAGKVVFSTEVKVEHMNSKIAMLELRAKEVEAVTGESKSAHSVLAERVASNANVLALKASAESVNALQRSVDDLRTDIREGFAEINKRLDENAHR